ncbi:hypothetical protein ACOMHN_009367 [Nucella lapillus]
MKDPVSCMLEPGCIVSSLAQSVCGVRLGVVRHADDWEVSS